MREIKFRAWLTDSEQMVFANDQCSTDYCEIWIFTENNIKIQVQETIWREGGGETFERIEYVDVDAKIMQYTGLKDKNGKEIYEGDVVLFDYEKILVSYGIQGVDAFEGIGFNLWSHYGQKQDGTRLQSEIEVVGNIYESPELLNTSI